MPLSEQGKEMLERFKKEYGAEKGEANFYAYLNSHPDTKHKVEGKRASAAYAGVVSAEEILLKVAEVVNADSLRKLFERQVKADVKAITDNEGDLTNFKQLFMEPSKDNFYAAVEERAHANIEGASDDMKRALALSEGRPAAYTNLFIAKLMAEVIADIELNPLADSLGPQIYETPEIKQ